MQAGDNIIMQQEEANRREGDGMEHESDDGSINSFEYADDMAVLRNLEENDPEVLDYYELCPSGGVYEDYRSIDWANRGRDDFANATHLKELYIEGGTLSPSRPSEWQNAIHFYRALAANRSIAELTVQGCLVHVWIMLEVMMPFFEHNKNLHTFDVSSLNMCPKSNRLLVLALSKCNSLRSLRLHFSWGVDSMDTTEIIRAVANQHHSLESLSLKFGIGDGIDDNQWCAALELALQHPVSKLRELNIEGCGICDVGIAFIGSALTNNTSLKTLNLENNSDITACSCTLQHYGANTSMEAPTLSPRRRYLNSNGDKSSAAILVFAIYTLVANTNVAPHPKSPSNTELTTDIHSFRFPS